MKKSGRKVISIILTAVMVLALLPIITRPIIAEAETTLPTNHTHGAHADGTCSEHVGWIAISNEDDFGNLYSHRALSCIAQRDEGGLGQSVYGKHTSVYP